MKRFSRYLLAAVSCLIVLIGCRRDDIIGNKVVNVTKVSLSPTTITLYEGDTQALTVSVEPEDATDKEITWTVDHPKVASVDENGKITAIHAGTATITATNPASKMGAICKVTVKEPIPDIIPATGILIDAQKVTLKVDETLQITATVLPSNTDEKEVNWASSNPAVASVDNGFVRALSAGETTVTASTIGGKYSASCVITVKNPTTPTTGGRWEDTGATLNDYPSYNKVTAQSDFPRIDITVSGTIQHGVYKDGTVSFKDPKKMYSDITDYSSLKMQIKGRGNTTWNAEGGIKNPYRMKLEEHPVNKIFGLNRDKDWILLADVQDPTLLRNAVALRISRMVSMPWTPKFRAVELYINNKYSGCYLLVEAKETDIENKVPVEVSETGEVDSGYYLEIDDKWDEDKYFYTSHFGKKIKYKDPEEPTTAQKEYIEGYVNDVEKLLKDKKFDKSTGYWSKMEVGTFIDQYIVQELTMNVDGNMRLSTYFAKDKDTKLFMPMVWDFDLALGNCTYLGKDFDLPYYDGSRDGPKGWFIKIRGGYPSENHGKKDTYYQYLFMDPQFVQALKDRWNTVKPRLDKIPAFIDKMAEYNKPAYDHNSSAGKNPRGNRGYNYPPDAFNDWQEAVDWLKEWYSIRLEWLDTEINALQ